MLPKICIVSDRRVDGIISGAENRISNFARYMSKKGFFIVLVDSARNRYFYIVDGTLKEKPLQFSRVVQFLSYSRRVFSKVLSIFTSLGEADSWLMAQAFDLGLFALLLRIFLRERPDVIQAEFPWTTLPTFLAKKLSGIGKMVLDEHNVETIRFRRLRESRSTISLVLAMERFACRISDFIFVVSSDDSNILQNWNISKGKVATISNSVETDVFHPEINPRRVLRKINAPSVVIVFHGNLLYAPNKEAVNLIISFIMPKIVKKYPSVKFLIVGPTPPKFLHPNVTFTGYVENLPDYIAAADLAIVPLLKGGGTRIKILEYMACGKPVVSTRIGAEGLNLENGREIILVGEISDSFVEKVIELIENKELRVIIGINARKKVVNKYSWYETCERAKKIYLDLCKNKV